MMRRLPTRGGIGPGGFSAFGLTLVSAVEGNGMSLVGRAVVTEFGVELTYPWIYTFFMIASVLGILVTSSVLRRIGATALLLLCGLWILGGGTLSVFAANMPVFLAGRMIQGAAVGGVTVIIFTWAATRPTPQDSRRSLTMIGGATAIAAAVGPAVSTAFLEALSWRWFIATITVGLVILVLVFLASRGNLTTVAREPVTALGGPWLYSVLIATFATGVAQIAVTRSRTMTAVAIVVALAALLYAIGHGLRRWSPRARWHALVAAAMAAVFAVSTYGLAAHMASLHGYLAAGLVLSGGAVGWYAGGRWLVLGRETRAIEPVIAALPALAVVVTAAVAASSSSLWVVALCWIVVGAVFGGLIPLAQVRFFAGVHESSVGASTVLQVIVSVAGAAVMTTSDTVASSVLATSVVPVTARLLVAAAIVAMIAAATTIALHLVRGRSQPAADNPPEERSEQRGPG